MFGVLNRNYSQAKKAVSMSSSSDVTIKEKELSLCISEVRNMLLRQCWLYVARKHVIHIYSKSIFGRLWDKDRPLRSCVVALFSVTIALIPVTAKFYFDLGGLFMVLLEVYQWWIIGPQSVLLVIGVISSPSGTTLRLYFRNHIVQAGGGAIAAAVLAVFSVFSKSYFAFSKVGDALLATWIWCVVGPVLVATVISWLTSPKRDSQDESEKSDLPCSKRLLTCLCLVPIIWVSYVLLVVYLDPDSLWRDFLAAIRWCFADCIFVAIVVYFIACIGNKVIEGRQRTPMIKWSLVGAVVAVVASVVLVLVRKWFDLYWFVDAVFVDITHYCLGMLVIAAFIPSSGWFETNEPDDRVGSDREDDHDEPVIWGRIQFGLLLFFAVYLTLAMLAVVWLSWKQAQEGSDGFLYVMVPAYLAATCLMVGGVVENLYVPLRRVPHVDIVCVSKFMKSTGWALLPVPFILVLVGAFIRNIGKADDRIVQVIGFSLTSLTWIASYLRQQRRWYVEYVEAREKFEEELDRLAPKTVSRKNGPDYQIKTELECSKNEVEALIHLVREGVSLKYSSMPLVPSEILSLYIASRICMWPIIRQSFIDYWSLGEAVQQEPTGHSGEGMYELFGRLIVEFEALPGHIIECIKDNVKNLAKRDFECDGTSCGKKFLAADILVRETVFSGGIFVR